jgi:hypothetical protein
VRRYAVFQWLHAAAFPASFYALLVLVLLLLLLLLLAAAAAGPCVDAAVMIPCVAAA